MRIRQPKYDQDRQELQRFPPFQTSQTVAWLKEDAFTRKSEAERWTQEGLSCIDVKKSKDCFKTILDVTRKPKESVAVDDKFVDDWEDDSSFQDLILVDGSTTRGAIDDDSPGSHAEVYRAMVEVSNRSVGFLKSPHLDSAGDPNTDLGAAAKGRGTVFPEHKQQSQDSHTDILVNTLEFGQKYPDENKPQITDRCSNFNRASYSTTGHQMELLESPKQTEDKKCVDSVESSWLMVNTSLKGVGNCVESCNSCSGISSAVQSDVSAPGLLQVAVAENASKKAGNSLKEFGAADDVKEAASKFSAAASICVLSVSETAGSVGDVKDPMEMSTFSVGFTTAGGSKVSVSDKALRHARSFLGEAGDVEDVKDGMPAFSGGFTTARGSKVSVSDKALQHARSFLGEAGDVEDVKDVMPAFSGGFTTARGSNVSVSDKALQHARSFLGEAGDVEDVKDVMPAFSGGFTTAWGHQEFHARLRLSRMIGNNIQASDRNNLEFDRRKTRGKSLSAVLSMPLKSVSGMTVSPAVLGNKFQPPYKKAKVHDDDSSYNSMATSSSGTITCSDSYSSTAASATSFTSSSSAAAPSKFSMGMCHKSNSAEPTALLETPNEQLLGPSNNSGRRLCSFREDSNWSKAFQGAAADLSNPSASTSSLKKASGVALGSQCSSTSHQPKLISDSASHGRTSHPSYPTLDLMLEESRMKQDAVIRKKQKGTIRPVCGRWLEFKKRKEALKTLKSLGLVPETGLAREELLSQGVSDSCLQVNSLNAGSFRFDLRRFYPCLDACILVGDGALLIPDKHGFCGAQEFYRALLTLDGVDPRLVDETWVQNHYRWIVWKLAAYEVCFPGSFAGRSLIPEMVMLQLKYRYDREIDLCHRSAIKKIVERDDTPCKRLILCVASVKQTLHGQFSVELTDGWYSIPAQLDDCLTQLVARKRIRPGDKIVSTGAELGGCADGCSPLELKEGTALKLNGNATRPAPWYSRLGYCFPPSALCVPLSSLSLSGGLASCVDVVFCRKYPVLYMEKLQDGSSVFRTAEEEDKARQKHEDWLQMEGEKIYMSLQKELENDTRAGRPGRGRTGQKDIKSLWSGQDVAAALEDALNPEELQQSLSCSQMERLMTYRQAEVERRQQEINRKLQEVMTEACKPRHVTSVVKFKVRGCCRRDVDSRSSCHLVVWRPGSEWMEVEEGKRYKLFNVSVTPGRGRSEQGKVVLTATRQTRIQACPISDNLLDIVYNRRDAWTVRELLSGQPFEDEFDFIGVVIQVVAPAKSTGPTCVFAADKNREILCIRFWTTSLMTTLQPGQCFVASSLNLARGLQNSGSRPGLVSADARSDVTSVSTSARCARKYSDLFAQVTSISKTKGFLSDLQRKLQVHGYSTDSGHNGHLMSRHQDYHEDFPPEIVDKIFAPMSQETLATGRQATLVDMWKQQPSANQQNLATCGGLLQPSYESGKGLQSSDRGAVCSSAIVTASTAVTNSILNTKQTICDEQPVLNRGGDISSESVQGDIRWEKNPSLKRKHEDEALDTMSKRKSILRTKMSKLLAYERPSKLAPLPCGNSPASKKEYKSPIAKKL
ncbi:unnamed protein product [Candidula unifasciata]|uniref:Tower domain-containing protein n=1 Tax=Candidula unifasciata TaxID=100452 RepID=A0A8S3ZBK5_9EUPU|nr:unnamed protein product [Candidula unifasciata]